MKSGALLCCPLCRSPRRSRVQTGKLVGESPGCALSAKLKYGGKFVAPGSCLGCPEGRSRRWKMLWFYKSQMHGVKGASRMKKAFCGVVVR